jgi:arylsulfatase A-like enzyme
LKTPISAILILAAAWVCAAAPLSRPNIVFILADDLGYGDVQCFNPQHGLIRTPNLDRLAAQGMTFTDAHSGSSVCTPTRYGVLTGRYSWRSRLQAGVLNGFSPRLIETGRLTVPALLKQHGYATVGIGKWHLGMTWPRNRSGNSGDGSRGKAKAANQMNSVDWTKPIQDGPTAHGFDYYFGISASLDMPPFVFIENDHVTAVPTTTKKWIRSGPAAADFEAVDVLPQFTAKAIEQIKSRAVEAKAGKPFFLYLALNSPHTPVVPAPEWKGKSGLGDYADFVMQSDAAIGQVLAALEDQGLTSNTLVIATSDNGFSPAGDPQARLRDRGHQPSAQFRGYKADIWDGGHRVPFLARWDGRIKPGSRSSQLICLIDLMATCAELLEAKLPDNAGEDSVSILPALLESAKGPLREAVVHHSINGSFAIRQGSWKLELCAGSGGWSVPKPGSTEEKGLPPVQLYDLSAENGEQKNLQAEHPETVARLTRLLEKYVAGGRSTPGTQQTNDAPIKLWKTSAPAGMEAE